jgi:hypothetical protein
MTRIIRILKPIGVAALVVYAVLRLDDDWGAAVVALAAAGLLAMT